MKCFSLASSSNQASEFCQVIKLNATVITFLEVSIHNMPRTAVAISINKACHVWLATRQELDALGASEW